MQPEANNEALKLIAQSIEILEKFNSEDWYQQLDDTVLLLKQAIDKLAG